MLSKPLFLDLLLLGQAYLLRFDIVTACGSLPLDLFRLPSDKGSETGSPILCLKLVFGISYLTVFIFKFGLLMHFVPFVVFVIHLVSSGFAHTCLGYNHGIGDTKANTTQEAGYSQEIVVSASQRSSSPFFSEAQTHLPGASPSSFERSDLFEPHRSYNVRQCSVAMSGVQAASQALSQLLPRLSAAMASSHGSNLHPPAGWAEVARSICIELELQSWMGRPSQLGWQRSLPKQDPYSKEGHEAKRREDAQEQCLRRRQGSTHATLPCGSQLRQGPTVTATANALAWLCRDGPTYHDADTDATHAGSDAINATTASPTATGTDGAWRRHLPLKHR